jgi:uncharacterized phage infection (PIP) family protein YhgE
MDTMKAELATQRAQHEKDMSAARSAGEQAIAALQKELAQKQEHLRAQLDQVHADSTAVPVPASKQTAATHDSAIKNMLDAFSTTPVAPSALDALHVAVTKLSGRVTGASPVVTHIPALRLAFQAVTTNLESATRAFNDDEELPGASEEDVITRVQQLLSHVGNLELGIPPLIAACSGLAAALGDTVDGVEHLHGETSGATQKVAELQRSLSTAVAAKAEAEFALADEVKQQDAAARRSNDTHAAQVAQLVSQVRRS